MADNLEAATKRMNNRLAPVDAPIKLSDFGFTILQIETMLACNMRCKYCAYPLTEAKGAKLAADDVYKVIDSVDSRDDSLEYLCFNQYNEPLLDERVFDFIKYAKEKGFKVKIITNGLLLKSSEIRQKLIEAAPTYIKISLETLNEDAFTTSRGINSSFSEYKQGILEFLTLADEQQTDSMVVMDIACNFLTGPELALRATMGLEHGDPAVPNTTEEITEGFLGLLKELQAINPRFAHNEAEALSYLKTVSKTYLDQQELRISENIALKIKQFIYGRRLSTFYPAFKTSRCETRILAVLASGSVVPCCLAYNDILTMGNIKRESLREILARNTTFINRIQESNELPEVCHKCKGAPTRRGALIVSLKRFLMPSA